MPEIADDGHLDDQSAPGHPVHRRSRVQGEPRDLVAADYVYSLKRWLDPNLKARRRRALTDLIVGARPGRRRGA